MTPAKMPETVAEHANLAEALAAFQAEAPVLPKTGSNPAFGGSKYTKLGEAVPIVAPLMAKHGLAWTAKPGRNEHGELVLQYRLVHAPSLDHDDGELPLMLDRQNAQGLGSAITYARRQAMFAQLNLVGDEDDDDGQRAGSGPNRPAQTGSGGPSPAQREIIERLFAEKAFTRTELAERLPEGVEITAGWVDRLTPGKQGTASALIDWLLKLPKKQHAMEPPPPSDVPSDDAPEHPPVEPDQDIPFDPEGPQDA